MAIIVESFEDVLVGPNSPLFYTGTIQVGASTPFTFASGVTLTSPIPNTAPVGSGPVFVADFDQGLAPALLEKNGPLTSDTVPTGAAYFHTNLHNPAFSFNQPVFTVSVKGIADDFVALAAYDVTGKFITAAEIRTVATSNWDTNVVQVMSKTPIAKVVILGDDTKIDDLTFDTGKPTIRKGTKKADDIKGKNKAELIDGRKGNDKLDGRGGDDTILGGPGKDKIKGGKGNDILDGGPGADILKGGPGQDSFIFGAFGAVDKIKDFNPFDDTIVLQRSTFSKFSDDHEYVQDSQFVVGPAALDANDFLIYNFATGELFYDPDGSGPIAQVKFAKLSSGLALTAADFLVV